MILRDKSSVRPLSPFNLIPSPLPNELSTPSHTSQPAHCDDKKRRRRAIGGAEAGPHAAEAGGNGVALTGKTQGGLHLRKDLPAPLRFAIRHFLNVWYLRSVTNADS